MLLMAMSRSIGPDLGFLGGSLFLRKTQDYEGWKSLDFLGFSRPNLDLSMGYAGFSGNFFLAPFVAAKAPSRR
jgi:hypothetical protein